jgi:hypothetical protein
MKSLPEKPQEFTTQNVPAHHSVRNREVTFVDMGTSKNRFADS